MTSSPGLSSAVIPKYMIGLPPGTTHTLSAPTGMPRVVETYAAMASRSSGNPGVGPYFVQPSPSAF